MCHWIVVRHRLKTAKHVCLKPPMCYHIRSCGLKPNLNAIFKTFMARLIFNILPRFSAYFSCKQQITFAHDLIGHLLIFSASMKPTIESQHTQIID